MRNFDHISGKHHQINGANIYYEEIGDKEAPVLLFLHGGLGQIENFNAVISELSDQFRIIGIDSCGHGKSTLGSQELSYELLQKEVEAILTHLNIQEVTIVGFSNGGCVAYRLAALTNLKINKLVTIGAPWCREHFLQPARETFSQLTSDLWKTHCPRDYESYMRLNPEPQFDKFFKQLIQMALDTGSTGRPNESIRNISCPLFAIRGEHDTVLSNTDLLEISQHVKNSQFLTIPEAGHEAFLDQHQIFTTVLKKFLAIP